MKYADIPKLTQAGGYEVSIRLKRVDSALEDYRAAYGLDMDPDFQRGHVWTENQQRLYIEFLLRGGKSGRVIYFNCPSFGRGGSPEVRMVLVDGKQRLNAISRFMRDELKPFGCCASEIEDLPLIALDVLFNVNSLHTRAEVLNWYLEMNGAGTPHTAEELARVSALLEQERTTG